MKRNHKVWDLISFRGPWGHGDLLTRIGIPNQLPEPAQRRKTKRFRQKLVQHQARSQFQRQKKKIIIMSVRHCTTLRPLWQIRAGREQIQCCSSSPFVLILTVPLCATLSMWRVAKKHCPVILQFGQVVQVMTMKSKAINLNALVDCLEYSARENAGNPQEFEC